MSSTPHTPTGVPDVDTGFLVPASGFARRRSRGRRRDAAMDRGDSIGHVDRTSRIQSEVIRGAEGLQAVLQLARRDVKPIGRRAAGSLTGSERRGGVGTWNLENFFPPGSLIAILPTP